MDEWAGLRLRIIAMKELLLKSFGGAEALFSWVGGGAISCAAQARLERIAYGLLSRVRYLVR